MRLKLGWGGGKGGGENKEDGENTPKSGRSLFGRKSKKSPRASESSRASPGLSEYSVDMDALHRAQNGGENAPPADARAPLQKAPSDAQSTNNLRQLAKFCLADAEDTCASAGAPQQSEEELAEATAAAVQEISERSAELATAAQGAKAHRASCLALVAFGSSIVEVLEARAPVTAAPDQLAKVACLLGDSTTLVASCAGPDWLLVAASPEAGVCEAAHALHADMLATLKGQGLDCVPGTLRLAGPDYRDGSKALQRRLKQLGGGSLAVGLQAVAAGEEEQQELARTLDAEPEDVRRSASHVAAGLAGAGAGAGAADDEAVAAHRAALQSLFASYSTFGARDQGGAALELDSFRCSKLVREAGLLGGPLRAQDLDVLFAKAARQGSSRKLPIDGFLTLLALLAEKKGVALGEVVGAVSRLEGPTVRGTTPEHVKWHDDKSTYTGVYARGGLSVADDTLDLGRMVDRDAAEKAQRRASAPGSRRASLPAGDAARRTPTPVPTATPPLSRTASGAGAGPKEGAKHATAAAAGTPTAGAASPRIRAFGSQEENPAAADPRGLCDMWSQFAAFGRSAGAPGELSMDGAQFMKLCRDSGLLTRGLSSTRVDLIFRTTAAKGARRITYSQFQAALPRLAEARGCEEGEVVSRIVASTGPTRNNTTTPEAVRLSDRSSFTGIAARGGPTTVEKERITLAGMCDRSGRRSSLAR